MPLLAHNVYFTLNDSSPAACARLVAACKKYLSTHPGTVFFSAGTRAKELTRPVNDQEYDVSLHVFFSDAASQEAYQIAPLHATFIEENKANWKKVRVFDSHVEK